jgi:DNA/RNA-binding domain of Phe-tRNA-synthetase-like protein
MQDSRNMAFIIDPAIWRIFPGLKLVVSVVSSLDNRAVNTALIENLDSTVRALREDWPYANAQSHPHIAAWRNAIGLLGHSSSRFPASIEGLCRRMLQGKDLRSINPLVDFYTQLSLRFVIPFGGWDLDRIAGEHIYLRPTLKGERFTELGPRQGVEVEANEIAYADDEGLVTRHFIWRQSDRAKITPETRNVFLVSEVLADLPVITAEAARDAIICGFTQYFRAHAHTAVLAESPQRWEF